MEKWEEVWMRQVLLFGEEMQRRLRESRVLVVGVGGLGCFASMLLARLGVGKLVLWDRGVVDLPDLHRQILYDPADLGRRKVDAAREKLERECPWTEIETVYGEIAPDPVMGNVDVVVSCLDNFTSRYVLDELVWKYNLGMVHGGVEGYLGQVTTIIPGVTPRLGEIFPAFRDSSDPIPVYPVTVSMVATIQVNETLQIVAGITPTLAGKLLLVDLEDYEFELVNLRSLRQDSR